MKLTTEHLAKNFNDRLRLLMRSCEAYDEGDYAEAPRLASSIVKLIDDRVNQKTGEPKKSFISLASRLGIKPPQMIDLSLPNVINQENLHGPLCIMGFHLSEASGLVPALDGFERTNIEPFRQTAFDEWWNSPVLRDCRGNEFTRKYIVQTMRDKEDVHTDGDLESPYAEVAYNGAIGIQQFDHSSIHFDMNPAGVVVRQIAHEVLRTFMPDLPPRFVSTYGLQVQPFVVYEIMEKDEAGVLIPVHDHRAMEFQLETTSTPEVWKAWERFVSDGKGLAGGVPKARTRDWSIRVGFINYAPHPIEDLRVMVSMQHPLAPTFPSRIGDDNP